MGSGGQRSVKRRAAGGGATTVAAAATSAASTGGGGAVGRNLSGTETFASLDQKAQESIISNAVKAPQKNSYRAYGTSYQKFINNSGLDGKPQLMDSDDFDKENGPVIYRTVNSNSAFSAAGVAENVAKDDTFLYNGDGGTAHGLGLYSTPNLSGSLSYGYNRDNSTAVMRFKIRDDAKIINEQDLRDQVFNEGLKPGSLVYNLQRDYGYDKHMTRAIYAMSKGYSIVTEAKGKDQKSIRKAMMDGGDHYTEVLNRGALIMDNQTKTMMSKTSNRPGSTWDELKDNHKIK